MIRIIFCLLIIIYSCSSNKQSTELYSFFKAKGLKDQSKVYFFTYPECINCMEKLFSSINQLSDNDGFIILAYKKKYQKEILSKYSFNSKINILESPGMFTSISPNLIYHVNHKTKIVLIQDTFKLLKK